MRVVVSSEFLQLENWLAILIATYNENPTCGLAKTIHYYIERLLHHEDIYLDGDKHNEHRVNKYCEYLCMKKFWRWQAKT